MPNYLATVTLINTSGFPEDNFVNTFAINKLTAADAGNFTTWENALSDFYAADLAGGLQAFGYYLSPTISRSTPPVCRIYEVAGAVDGDGVMGSPVFQAPMTPLPASDSPTPLPDEVAICLTLRASQWAAAAIEAPDGADAGAEVDRPRQRRSGRIYLGPFNSNASTIQGGRARPNATLRTRILDAGERLFDNIAAVPGAEWSVWSRKDAVLRPITDLQVDDAFDTQRRRGPAATVRNNRVVFP